MNNYRLDELHDISDFKPETLQLLANRIEYSCDELHQIYRETELDEVWRWIDVAIGQSIYDRAPREKIDQLLSIKNEVMAIHDYVGIESDMQNAARRLHELATSLSQKPVSK